MKVLLTIRNVMLSKEYLRILKVQGICYLSGVLPPDGKRESLSKGDFLWHRHIRQPPYNSR